MIITLFESVHKAYTTLDGIIEDDWSTIAQYLQLFWEVPVKTDAPMFNMWVFNPNGEPGRRYHNNNRESWDYIPGTIRRCADNAIGVWGLVLDYDGGMTIEDAEDGLQGFEYVLYTTHRFSNSLHKFRVVVPFTRMLTKEEFRTKEDDIRTYFPNVDPASFSESQAIYLHSGAKQSNSISRHATGLMLDPSVFSNTDKVLHKLQTVYTPANNQYVLDILDELHTHYRVLPYKERFAVTRAVASTLSKQQTIYEMRKRWPDAEFNGKYEALLHDPLKENSPTLGTLLHMIRVKNPAFRKISHEQPKQLLRDAFRPQQQLLKSLF